jgi:hypothetical protein
MSNMVYVNVCLKRFDSGSLASRMIYSYFIDPSKLSWGDFSSNFGRITNGFSIQTSHAIELILYHQHTILSNPKCFGVFLGVDNEIVDHTYVHDIRNAMSDKRFVPLITSNIDHIWRDD